MIVGILREIKSEENRVTYAGVAEAFGLEHTPIDSFLE